MTIVVASALSHGSDKMKKKTTKSSVRYVIMYRLRADWGVWTYYSESSFKKAKKWLDKLENVHEKWIELLVITNVSVRLDDKGLQLK